MTTREMLRQSWRAWLDGSAPRVGAWWMNPLWTIAFSLVVALGFAAVFWVRQSHDSLAGWGGLYARTAVISLCVGFAVRTAFWAARRIVGTGRLDALNPWQRSLFFSTVSLLGVAVGWPLGLHWATGVDLARLLRMAEPRQVAGSLLIAFFITAVFQQFFSAKVRQIRAENRATEAQLRLLQAQIEPHFLFNTLANVTSLMDSDTARARLMLESFVDYLRASLSGLGGPGHTLGDELDLVDAYLRIIKIRMEDRLDYTIDVAEPLRALRLPALTLQPLVENAVVHGLEPQIAGGTLRIAARREGRSLVISVADDGSGMAAPHARPVETLGAGTALANIRLRLGQAYGSDASLRIEPARPHGVRARLLLPVSAA